MRITQRDTQHFTEPQAGLTQEGRLGLCQTLAPITRKRLDTPADFRHQAQVDKRLIAFGYGAVLRYYKQKYASQVRDYRVTELEADLRKFFKERFAEDSAFNASIADFIDKLVPETEVKDEARAFFKELGWKPPA